MKLTWTDNPTIHDGIQNIQFNQLNGVYPNQDIIGKVEHVQLLFVRLADLGILVHEVQKQQRKTL